MLTRSTGPLRGHACVVRGTFAAGGPLGPALRGVQAPIATGAPCLARETDPSLEAVAGTATSLSYLRLRPEPAETATFTAVESDNRYEIKDPELILDSVWRELERTIGFEHMAFPKEVLWLAGAPGAGKGTMSKAIMYERGIEEPPIEVSSLLNTPEAQKMKEAGQLIGDREVVLAVVKAMMQPKYRSGMIVDGFPRTVTQAEVIKLLYDRLLEVRQQHSNDTEVLSRFRRPIFHIAVLYVNEEVSVERQMARGRAIQEHNRRVMETGVGRIREMRGTDVDPELARRRYEGFKDEVYHALQAVKDKFAFHFIDADCSPEEVQRRINAEFEYQSSMELSDTTFEAIRSFPLASEVTRHARQNLVRRLDAYSRDNPTLLAQLMGVLERDFRHLIERQALTGGAIIRSVDPIFNNALCIDMALDVLTERGFTVVLDVIKHRVADEVTPSQKGGSTQRIMHRMNSTFVFHVNFPKPVIRREH